ncbi:MAG: hypothetical protein HYT86_09445, partial [candidate division NC10 bacterium]|nr:hypothetical protein [candidate division NC10 bacterium]
SAYAKHRGTFVALGLVEEGEGEGEGAGTTRGRPSGPPVAERRPG